MSLVSRMKSRKAATSLAAILPDGVTNADRAAPLPAARSAPSTPSPAPALAPMGLAARAQARALAEATATRPSRGPIVDRAGPVPAARSATPTPKSSPASAPASSDLSTAETRQVREMVLRFTHDVRRLKEIKGIDFKLAAKREMLPAYQAWIDGQVDAGAAVLSGVAAEILPTCMLWRIDIGDYAGAYALAEFALAHGLEMPKRFERDTASVVAEEFAERALRAQIDETPFPFDILDQVDALVAGVDLHDEIRSKLAKAIGAARLAEAEDMEAGASAPVLAAALVAMKEAQRLNPRAGVRTAIKRAEKLLLAVAQADAIEGQAGELADAAELDQAADQAPAPIAAKAKPAPAKKPAAKRAPAKKSAGSTGSKARPRR